MDRVVHAPGRRSTDRPDGGKGLQPAPQASRHHSDALADPLRLNLGLTAVGIAAEVIPTIPDPCYATALTGVSWVMTAATPAIRLSASQPLAGPDSPITICATGSILLEAHPSCPMAHHLNDTKA